MLIGPRPSDRPRANLARHHPNRVIASGRRLGGRGVVRLLLQVGHQRGPVGVKPTTPIRAARVNGSLDSAPAGVRLIQIGSPCVTGQQIEGSETKMMGLDNPVHLAFLLVILLLVFGAKRLPELGRSLGAGLRGFKDSISADGSTEALTPPRPLEQQAHTQPESAPVGRID